MNNTDIWELANLTGSTLEETYLMELLLSRHKAQQPLTAHRDILEQLKWLTSAKLAKLIKPRIDQGYIYRLKSRFAGSVYGFSPEGLSWLTDLAKDYDINSRWINYIIPAEAKEQLFRAYGVEKDFGLKFKNKLASNWLKTL